MLSFSVVTNILFFSSVAIIVLKIIFCNDRVVLRLDVRFVLICLMLVVLRLLVPVESPLVSRIPIFRIYPDAYRFLRKSLSGFGNIDISWIRILRVGWITGSTVCIIKHCVEYYLVARQIRTYKSLNNLEFSRVIEKINGEWEKNAKFKLVGSEYETVPCVFGVFKPYIVLPDKEYSQKEIYYILKHEMSHFYRGDMVARVLCEVLKAMYWWNPFIYMLSNLVVEMQEVNVDFGIIKGLPNMEQLEYSDCLIKVARRDICRGRNPYIAGFRRESPSAIHKRIGLMLKSLDMNGGKTVGSILLSVFVVCLITLCPSFFMFEPYSIPDMDIEGSAGIEDGGIYYLRNSDGTFSVYIDGQYFATVTKIFDKEIQIYDNPKEISKGK